MWEWIYTGKRLPDDRIAVSIKAGDQRLPAAQTEFLNAGIEIDIPAIPIEPRIRLGALQRLQTLVAAEIERIEDLLADGVR